MINWAQLSNIIIKKVFCEFSAIGLFLLISFWVILNSLLNIYYFKIASFITKIFIYQKLVSLSAKKSHTNIDLFKKVFFKLFFYLNDSFPNHISKPLFESTNYESIFATIGWKYKLWVGACSFLSPTSRKKELRWTERRNETHRNLLYFKKDISLSKLVCFVIYNNKNVFHALQLSTALPFFCFVLKLKKCGLSKSLL